MSLVVPIGQMQAAERPDRVFCDRAQQAYQADCLPISESKCFGFFEAPDGQPRSACSAFGLWGTAIGGVKGTCGVPVGKRLAIAELWLRAVSPARNERPPDQTPCFVFASLWT